MQFCIIVTRASKIATIASLLQALTISLIAEHVKGTVCPTAQQVCGEYKRNVMKLKFSMLATMVLMSSPAFAGNNVPSPEAGAGLASMAIIAAGYIYLRKRIGRR
jgi:hypothetical protein